MLKESIFNPPSALPDTTLLPESPFPAAFRRKLLQHAVELPDPIGRKTTTPYRFYSNGSFARTNVFADAAKFRLDGHGRRLRRRRGFVEL